MRGKNKKPTFKHISIRVTREVYDYFYQYPFPTKEIREALTQYVKIKVGDLPYNQEETDND
jgi:hypothetical protein